jgi:hypothetical protein
MIRRNLAAAGALCGMLLAGVQFGWAQSDVTQPGDALIASSPNNPGSEGVANAIDNQPTKYLNFDAADGTDVGFIVTPSVGLTRVTGIAMQSANDAPERDPKDVRLEGSNDETVTGWAEGNWTVIAEITVPAYTERFQTQTFQFENLIPYRHYRWTVLEVQDVAAANSMQIAEVELLGKVVPSDVTQPGDALIASSPNNPGSEGVANAIDNQPTKYLNFDAADGTDVGFIVSPAVGRTLVTGISMQSANDAPERDPRDVRLEGSNDETVTAWAEGNWTVITEITVPAYTARFQTQTFLFDNFVPYRHYRWTVLEVQDVAAANSMQIAEVELLGTGEPKDVTQPGDALVASSPNNPGSEGVANAIDNQPTKYLNFDAADGTDVGFIVTPSVGATAVTGMTLQSANDAPERDPKDVRLEGSNDETITGWAEGNWTLIVEFTVPAFTERFQVQEFFFPNNTAYKHYRWTVLEVQDVAAANSMQIAEVELLAATDQADCDKARILTAPENTPVLSGQAATFFTVVNGPWPLQWRRNGEIIPGATQLTYTTEPITTANEADEYTVEIVGCQVSDPVRARVFTPDTTLSYGISWDGGGANGAPTAILPEDIAGIHLQAYWNNIAEVSGTSVVLTNSNNQASDGVTVTFASSGEWGAGTGNVIPRQRLLNGLIFANPGAPGTVTFENVPAGNHSVIAYTVGIPLQFQDQDYTVTGAASQSVYTTQMNADQYNPNPTWVRGTSPDPSVRTLANYVRFQNVQPAANGTITLNWSTATTGFDRGVALNAVQLLINPPAIAEPPQLVQGPQPTETLQGANVVLNVLATGDDLTYQWRKDGQNLSDLGSVSGSKTDQLTIRSFQPGDTGFYSVLVQNAGGSIITEAVKVKVVAADRTITGPLIAHFKFDESSGTTAANSGTDAINGTLFAAAWGPGKIGGAYTELFSLNAVTVPNYTKIQEEVTVSAWVKLDPNLAASDYQIVRNASGALGVAAPLEQFEFDLDFNDTDPLNPVMNLRARVAAGPNITTVRENAAFPLDTWQHVAFTADGGQVRLYRNGQLVATGAYLDPINQPNVEWLSVGARLLDTAGVIDFDTGEAPNAGDQTLYGAIDDLGIWLFAWPASVIQSIYEQGNATQDLTTAALPVLPPPSEDILLTVGLEGGNVVISWAPEGGTLETTSNIGDPDSWTPVAGNPNPYTTPAAGNAYFRVRN